jgi:hypothetical protein
VQSGISRHPGMPWLGVDRLRLLRRVLDATGVGTDGVVAWGIAVGLGARAGTETLSRPRR